MTLRRTGFLIQANRCVITERLTLRVQRTRFLQSRLGQTIEHRITRQAEDKIGVGQRINQLDEFGVGEMPVAAHQNMGVRKTKFQ